MKKVKLSELFDVINGKHIDKSKLSHRKKNDLYIPYIRPSNSMSNIISGYVIRTSIAPKQIFEAGNLFVGTNGQGSHTFSYVCPYEFTPNSDVSVLIPKRDMSLVEKNVYAIFITANRYKFSYGRKPKGDKLKSIKLPSLECVKNLINKFPKLNPPSQKPYHYERTSLNDHQWNWFHTSDIFENSLAKVVDKQNIKNIKGNYPYISETTKNNGVNKYISNMGLENYVNKGDVISIGLVGVQPFYQKDNFLTSSSINILKLKSPSNIYIQIFICTILKMDMYRYNYGRKRTNGRIKAERLKLPVDQRNNPDWNFIEYYIKSLPYSSNLK